MRLKNLFDPADKGTTQIPKQKIVESDWDYFIILDACRFDFFKDMYKQYLNGKVKKVQSKGTSTIDWLKSNFQSYHQDITYISTNPYINSKVEVSGFKASRHFGKIVDVWLSGWDKQLGTVPPRKVNDAVEKEIEDNKNRRRMIIHYLQPHYPYIGSNYGIKFNFNLNESDIRGNSISKLRSFIGPFLCNRYYYKFSKFLRLSDPRVPFWRGNEFFGGDAVSNEEKVYRYFRDDYKELRKAYKENLEIVLSQVSKLVEILEGKVIVTSDHGEGLGDGVIIHPGIKVPILLEVPWLEVER